MGYNFPNAPATGATYTPSGGPTYTWDGVAWKAVTQGVPTTVFAGDSPPPSPALGMLWWDSDTGNLFIWYNDGDSSQWVQVSGGAPQNAPVDGNEYVMCNGVWRLSKQSYDLAGLGAIDLIVPAWGPSEARITTFAIATGNSGNLHMRVSVDGVGFPAGATDYSVSGFWRRGDTGAITNAPNTSASQWAIGVGSDHPAIPFQTDTIVTLVKAAAGVAFAYRTRASGYWASMAFQEYYYNGYTPGAAWTALTLKALRVWLNGQVFASGKLTVEWLP